MLSKEEIEKFRKELLRQKKNFEEQLKKIARKDEEIKDNYRTSFPNYGSEDQDNAGEVSTYDRTLPLEGRLETGLKKINIALEKIREDQGYGLCENCGKEIGKKRLMAYPQAGKCIVCAKKEKNSS